MGPKLFAVELFTEFIQNNLLIKPFLCIDRFSKDNFLFLLLHWQYGCKLGTRGWGDGSVDKSTFPARVQATEFKSPVPT